MANEIHANHTADTQVSNQQVISDRARLLLKALIELYIREGQPVGSRTLSRESSIDLSPATVRNVMADLEELGLVRSPHTSAGRIPTAQGYRLFVDTLLTVKPLEDLEVRSLQSHLGIEADPKRVLESASSMLSEITQMAGIVMVPKREHVELRQVEFLPLSNRRILVILVINDREVQNRIIHTAREFTASELQQMSNYLNQKFSGRDLKGLRELILQELKDVREHMNQLMLNAVEMANQVFTQEQDGQEDYVLAGETHLMSYAEMADINKLRQLFDAFDRKRDILHVLDQALDADGVQLFIGEESGHEVLDECTVVTSPYKSEGEVVGVLGVIGPTRMAYDRVIPVVDVAAKLLSAALNHRR